MPAARERTMRRSLIFLALLILAAAPAAAQQDTSKVPTGVRLGLTYQPLPRPEIAVRPVGGRPEIAATATEATAILRQDLDFSDRFQLQEMVPAALASGAVDFKAWNSLGVVYLVTGDVVPAPTGGDQLHVALYDIVYGTVKQAGNFPLPPAQSPDFRMAVHRASDAVVLWATGKPGMAASRIAFVRRRGPASCAREGEGCTYEIVTVDSDGEDSRVVASSPSVLMSPAWSPDGARLAYLRGKGGHWDLLERDMRTGRASVLISRDQLLLTPAYSPDGGRLAFASWNGRGTEIDDYDVRQRCCLRRLTSGVREDLSPAYSPDGRRIAFNSDRIGQLHIYVMPAGGGEPDLISPYTYGEPGEYAGPDWSPEGARVAFHGRSRGEYQIMIADADHPGSTVRQITAAGRSTDPSWAADGRHLVFTGVREGGAGLYVIDTITGRQRPLLLGGRYRVPAWSPSLAGGVAGAAGP